MLKVVVKNQQGEMGWGGQFPTEEEANAWILLNVQNNSWGKPARTEYVDDTPTDFPSEYTIEIEDITSQWQAEQQQDQARQLLQKAKDFGNKVIEDFTLENMSMGITQDGMTGQVRKATAEVISALQTGSLYDAMDEARAIPEEKKDERYVTNARLLVAINKIEAFLGEEISEEL